MIQDELVRIIGAGLPGLAANLRPGFANFHSHIRERAGDKSFMLDYLSTICDR